MKGVIVNCLAEMITQHHGREKWEEILSKAGLQRNTVFLATDAIEDAAVLKVLNITCQTLGIPMPQAADAFGDYWVNVFAKKLYPFHYQGVSSAKNFLLKMNHVHHLATKNLENAQPPQFRYEWPDPRTLILTYISQRGLIDILVGLVKGVGKHFNTQLAIEKLSPEKLKITFPS